MRNQGFRWIRVLGAIVGLAHPGAPFSMAEGSSLNLRAAQGSVDRLGPDVLSESAAFQIDEATTIRVEITSTLTDLTTSVTGPSGQLVNPATVASFGGEFATFDGDLADSFLLAPTSPGTHHVYVFPSLGVGTYTAQFTAAPGLAEHVPVITEVATDSAVVAALVTTATSFPLSHPVVLTAALFEGPAPVAGATVSVAVTPPTGSDFLVSLLDDGNGADNAAGDGLYTGTFTPPETGGYTALAQISGVNSHSTPFVRVSGAAFSVVPARASLTGVLTDQGVDDNGNSLFDRLVVTAEVDVLVAGDFKTTATLRTTGGAMLQGQGAATLAVGTQTIAASIGAADILGVGEDGPYVIEAVDLVYLGPAGLEPGDWIAEGTQATQAYLLTSFERPPIELTGVNSDEVVDSDMDGDFDELVVRAGIRVATPGTYQYAVRLEDPCGEQIAFISGQQAFPSGANPEALVLTFDGAVIGGHGVNGPYAVRDLLVYGGPASLVAPVVADTQTYNAVQFDAFAGPPDCDANGAPDLCQVLAGQALDCNLNFHPDSCDVAEGASTDCNLDVVPDECQGDCNANAVFDPCELLGFAYAADDGTHERSIGAGGGDLLWLNQFDVELGAETMDALLVAWGSGIPNGTPTTVVLYDDPNDDGDPIDAVVVVSATVGSQNADTNALTTVPIPPTVAGSAGDSFFVGAYITYPADTFPASQDSGSPSLGRSWVAAGGPGSLSFSDLSLNPPFVIDLAGLPGNWLLRARSAGTPLDCNVNEVPDDCDITAGTSLDLNANDVPDECEAAPVAGAVPDGNDVPGTPLTVSKAANDEILLEWGASCLASDTDYEIYEGTLGDFDSHEALLCSTSSATSTTLLPDAASSYYLVVPRSASREGSYGVDSFGFERPVGIGACVPQSIGGCTGSRSTVTHPTHERRPPVWNGPQLRSSPAAPAAGADPPGQSRSRGPSR